MILQLVLPQQPFFLKINKALTFEPAQGHERFLKEKEKVFLDSACWPSNLMSISPSHGIFSLTKGIPDEPKRLFSLSICLYFLLMRRFEERKDVMLKTETNRQPIPKTTNSCLNSKKDFINHMAAVVSLVLR